MRFRRVWVAALALVASSAGAQTASLSVRAFGAKGDGRTLDTAAIQRALDACAKAGGGALRFPPGRYLCSTIRLRSRVNLALESGAELIGAPDPDLYSSLVPPKQAPESRFNPRWHRALIIGDSVEDVAIEGRGVINGNRVFDPQGEERMRGPHTILLGGCRRIALRDITIRDSANYAVLMEGCDDVDARGLKVTGGWDGIHFRGWPGRPCRRITIADCQLFTGDDAIAGRYWEDTLIERCVLNSSCNAIRLIGPATRLTVHGCLMYGPGHYEHRSSHRTNMLAGICLQPGAWDATTGALEQVNISEIAMHNVTTPLFLALKPGNKADGITVNRLSATGVYRAACSIESWADSSVRNVTISDMSVQFNGGGTAREAALRIGGPGVDARALPVWGLYARRVENLRLENVRLNRDKEDARPAMLFEQVRGLTIDGLRRPAESDEVLFRDVENLTARDVLPPLPSR